MSVLIKHCQIIFSEQLRYLEGVRKFMPWQHRELIEDALTMPNVKQYSKFKLRNISYISIK